MRNAVIVSPLIFIIIITAPLCALGKCNDVDNEYTYVSGRVPFKRDVYLRPIEIQPNKRLDLDRTLDYWMTNNVDKTWSPNILCINYGKSTRAGTLLSCKDVKTGVAFESEAPEEPWTITDNYFRIVDKKGNIEKLRSRPIPNGTAYGDTFAYRINAQCEKGVEEVWRLVNVGFDNGVKIEAVPFTFLEIYYIKIAPKTIRRFGGI